MLGKLEGLHLVGAPESAYTLSPEEALLINWHAQVGTQQVVVFWMHRIGLTSPPVIGVLAAQGKA
jgi:hypothetical protein